MLVVDAGNLFFKKINLVGTSADASKMTAEIIRDSYNEIGCDGFSPGEQDFAAGLEFLRDLQSGAGFPFLSANIRDNNDNLLFDPYKIINIGGRKVGLIGVTSHFERADIQVDDPISAIDKIIDEVNSQSDFIIILFHSTDADLLRFHRHNYPVNLVIQSKNRRKSSDGGDNKTPVFSCGARGKYIYQFDLAISDPDMDIVDLSPHKSNIKLADRRLKRLQKGNFNIPLEKIYKDDQKTLDLIKTLTEQRDNADIAINGAVNTLTYKEIPLDKTVFDRPDILKLVDDGKEKISQNTAPQPAIPLSPPAISPKGVN